MSALTITHPAVFLRPTKASTSVLLLLPLLPVVRIPPLPTELWVCIIAYALGRGDGRDENEKWRWTLQRVSPLFKAAALPYLYADPLFTTFSSFLRFFSYLQSSDSKWSPIHRSSHSIPGRYVRDLSLSAVAEPLSGRQVLLLNSSLTGLWPFVPRLQVVHLRPEWFLSGAVFRVLADNCKGLKVLKGVSWKPAVGVAASYEDCIVYLFKACTQLVELEVYGPGYPSVAILSSADSANESPLRLPHLHTLSLIGVFSAPFIPHLLRSSLPSLRYLNITSYNSLPGDISVTLLSTIGPKLTRLQFVRGPEWPSLPIAPCEHLLSYCPYLTSMTLIHPLPSRLVLPASSSHPLEHIYLPRPTTSMDYSSFVFRSLPLRSFDSLREIQLADFKWLKGLGMAGMAGVRDEMRHIAKQLKSRGVRLLDKDREESC